MLLSKAFYENPNVVYLAKDLVGKILHTQIDGQHAAAMITETEAYNGVDDKACHAYGGRRTQRTETLYANGGTSYVYLCYGIHYLFNVVVSEENDPKAVLIRGIQLIKGMETVAERRKNWKDMIGPGKVTQGMGITTTHDKVKLTGNQIWLTDENVNIGDQHIQIGPRIGIDYAEEDLLLPYRFWINPKDACILIEGIAL